MSLKNKSKVVYISYIYFNEEEFIIKFNFKVINNKVIKY
jgi:hypothetical protein